MKSTVLKPLWTLTDPKAVCKLLLTLGKFNASVQTRSVKNPVYCLPFESFHFLFKNLLTIPPSTQQQIGSLFQEKFLEPTICKNPHYPVGFINQNNNCFVISILQCLFAVDTFSNILSTALNFDNTSSSSHSNDISIYKETSNLLKRYNKRKLEKYNIDFPFPLDTIDFQNSLQNKYSEYKDGAEYEAQEFLSR